MNEYFIGDWGRFKFTVNIKGKKCYRDLYAEIKSLDGKFIYLVDNDNFPHLIPKSNIEYFRKEKRNV